MDYNMDYEIDYEKELKSFNYKDIAIHRKRLRIDQTQLANYLNLTKRTISKYETGHPVPEKVIRQLIEVFKMETWSETSDECFDGCGMEYSKLGDNCFSMKVPIVKAESRIDFIHDYKTSDLSVSFLTNKINDGFYVAFEIIEMSMDDNSRRSLSKGDIAITKEVDKNSFKRLKDWSDLWVIILGEEILCKKVQEFKPVSNEVIFCSLNPSKEFGSFSADLKSITKIYQVKQRITNF